MSGDLATRQPGVAATRRDPTTRAALRRLAARREWRAWASASRRSSSRRLLRRDLRGRRRRCWRSPLAAVPLGIVIPTFLWLDRFEAEPTRYLVAAFLWGALVAAARRGGLQHRRQSPFQAATGDPRCGARDDRGPRRPRRRGGRSRGCSSCWCGGSCAPGVRRHHRRHGLRRDRARPASPSPRTSSTSAWPTPTAATRPSPARSSPAACSAVRPPHVHRPHRHRHRHRGDEPHPVPRVVAPVGGFRPRGARARAVEPRRGHRRRRACSRSTSSSRCRSSSPSSASSCGRAAARAGSSAATSAPTPTPAGCRRPRSRCSSSMPHRREARVWARANTGRAGLASMRGFQDTASELALLRARMHHCAADDQAWHRSASCSTPSVPAAEFIGMPYLSAHVEPAPRRHAGPGFSTRPSRDSPRTPVGPDSPDAVRPCQPHRPERFP